MDDTTHTLKEVNPANPPAPLDQAAKDEIASLAARQRKANGVLIKAINFVGGQVEDTLKLLPGDARAQLDELAK